MVSTASDSPDKTVDKDRKQQILALLKSLNIKRPRNYELYDRALTHSSYTYENKLSAFDNYERLEYLGDAVLKLVVSEYLFERFPDYREGDLTKIRAVVVSDAKLAEVAKMMNLGEYIIFGASEAKSGGRKKVSNLACAFEALLGALYLDGKIAEVREMTRNPPIRDSSMINDSVSPSTKKSWPASPERLRNGSTATDPTASDSTALALRHAPLTDRTSAAITMARPPARSVSRVGTARAGGSGTVAGCSELSGVGGVTAGSAPASAAVGASSGATNR